MNPSLFAVVGDPVAHSMSPKLHQLFAAQFDHKIVYEKIQTTAEHFEMTLQNFRQRGGLGLNVTVPHKTLAWSLVTSHTPEALAAQAVNAIKFEPGGGLLGANFDGLGLVRDLTVNLGIDLASARLLLIGAGGAARGVVLPLCEAGIAQLWIANRTATHAKQLRQQFPEPLPLQASGFEALENARFDVVINATSTSLYDQVPAIPISCLADAWCYDMVYQQVRFTDWALSHGARGASDGLGMLVEQGADSYHFWQGVRPETSAILAYLRSQ